MCVRVHLFTQCGSEGPAPKSLIEAQETRHRTQKEPHSQGLGVSGYRNPPPVRATADKAGGNTAGARCQVCLQRSLRTK